MRTISSTLFDSANRYAKTSNINKISQKNNKKKMIKNSNHKHKNLTHS